MNSQASGEGFNAGEKWKEREDKQQQGGWVWFRWR